MISRRGGAAVAYAQALLDGLVAGGVEHVCLSPGSRSTPLAVAVATDRRLRLWVHIDERSAAFFALGLAKATRRPVALVCTSGTAAANFYPAVIEAKYGRQPLVVLTADRPHELREVGAPQAVDQIRLYGPHVKTFVEMAPPAEDDAMLRYARTTALRAAATAAAAPPGPVHLNLPFREPFLVEPVRTASMEADAPNVVAAKASGAGPEVLSGRRRLSEDEAASLLTLLAGRRGLIVCGPQEDEALPAALAELGAALRWPILADPLSGLRCGRHDRTRVVSTYDVLLRSERWAQRMAPEVILRFGAMPTSKAYRLYAERHAGARQWVIDPGGEWPDPTLRSDRMIYGDPVELCRVWTSRLRAGDERARAMARGEAWTERWLRADQTAADALASEVMSLAERFEGAVFPLLLETLPAGATLVVGNSMPVRDADLFLRGRELPLRVVGNRGANGIDGLLSTAFGIAAGTEAPTLLVVGDLSFYHDLNGLLAAKRQGLDLVVLLIHNDGGGIFSFLPQAELVDDFERLFGTPHGLDFEPIVRGFGGRYTRAATAGELRHVLEGAFDEGGLHVIEWRTERRRNAVLHRQVIGAALAAVDGLAEEA